MKGGNMLVKDSKGILNVGMKVRTNGDYRRIYCGEKPDYIVGEICRITSYGFFVANNIPDFNFFQPRKIIQEIIYFQEIK